MLNIGTMFGCLMHPGKVVSVNEGVPIKSRKLMLSLPVGFPCIRRVSEWSKWSSVIPDEKFEARFSKEGNDIGPIWETGTKAVSVLKQENLVEK